VSIRSNAFALGFLPRLLDDVVVADLAELLVADLTVGLLAVLVFVILVVAGVATL
jgi:hypothetical protein